MLKTLKNTYSIVSIIGKGAEGQVFKATYIDENGNSQTAAIKQIKEGHSTTELEIYKLLNQDEVYSPNLIKLIDSTATKKGNYIIMEYEQGKDLEKEFVDSKEKREISELIQVFIQITSGLRFLHAHNIVHLDIKASNIIINDKGVVKLIDLGFACYIAQNILQGYQRNLECIKRLKLGTPNDMAPEIASRSVINISKYKAADVYSLGITFYMIITGEDPFPTAKTVEDLMELKQKPNIEVDFLGLADMRSEDLKQLIISMVSLDPDTRPTITDVLIKLYQIPMVKPRKTRNENF